jgi:ABC-type polysaccharide/polyol phosphate export permease
VGEIEGGHGFTEFVFCGLWPWLAFQEACLRSVTAITANANMVKKLQFPSELLVVAVVLASFLVQGVGFLLFLVGLMLWKGTFIGGAGLLLCLPLGLALLLAVGLGMLLACGNVFFRDVEQLATAGLTLWFFLTPILYPASLIPEAIGVLFLLNPMVAITDAYRSIILSGSLNLGGALVYSTGCGVGLFCFGWYAFARCRGFFADYL